MDSVDSPLRKLRFWKWASPKMQQIIKHAGSSRQHFETVNFAFMNFLILQSKWSFLGHFSIFWKICVICYLPDQVFEWTRNAWRKSPEKKRNVPKMAILTKKSKIFIKAKLTVSKSYLLGLVYLMIFCILRGGALI